jgi:hypothetical protein
MPINYKLPLSHGQRSSFRRKMSWPPAFLNDLKFTDPGLQHLEFPHCLKYVNMMLYVIILNNGPFAVEASLKMILWIIESQRDGISPLFSS